MDDGIPVGERAVGGADAVVAVGEGGSHVFEDVLRGFNARVRVSLSAVFER